MRATLTLILTAFAGSASAHTGHIADAAGHDHWVAGVAIGLAAAISVWGILKDRKEKAEEQAEEEETEAEGETA
jgi:beta-lactamase regulating signal transducer with metallopeptidase domain